jgi:polysaccharide biosynthesis/export protein
MTTSNRTPYTMTNLTCLPLAALAGLIILLPGCKSTGDTTPSTTPSTISASQDPAVANATVIPTLHGVPPDPGPAAIPRISVGDLIQIEVFQAKELSTKERVSASGEIILSLIGAIHVAGLTQEEAEKLITLKLGENYLQNPQVNLFIAESASEKVTVAGDVRAPGVFPIKGKMTLLEAIALAQGTKDTAKDEVVIFRGKDKKDIKAYVIDIEEVQKGTVPNPPLIGGDTVQVAQSGAMVFMNKFLGYVRLEAIPVSGTQ